MDVRMNKEQEEKEQKGKEKADDCIYTIIKVARDEDLAEQIGKEIYFDLVDHVKVRTFRIQKQMPFSQFKEEAAKAFGIPVQFQRYWLWAIRENYTYRPHHVLTSQEEIKPVGELREVSNKWNNNVLKLFLEDLRPLSPPGKTNKEEILLFFKLYDPLEEKLRYVGRLFVKESGKLLEIIPKLKEMAGFSPDEEVDLFEEMRFFPIVKCVKLDIMLSFRDSQLEDGDIVCFQKSLRNQSNKQYRFPDVRSFLEYVHNRKPEDHKITVPTQIPHPIGVARADTANTVVAQVVGHPTRFTWTVNSFSRVNVKKLYSDTLNVGGYQWRIMIYPKGNNTDHLSIYLAVADSATLAYGWKRYAQFSLAVINRIYDKCTVEKDTQYVFNASESDWGFTAFMPLSKLYDPERGYLLNDTIIIEAEIYICRQLLNVSDRLAKMTIAQA